MMGTFNKLPGDVWNVVASFLRCSRNLSHTNAALFGILRFRCVAFRDHSFLACMTTTRDWPVRHLHGRFVREPLGLIPGLRQFASCGDSLHSLTLDIQNGDLNAAWIIASQMFRLEELCLRVRASSLSSDDISLVQPFELARLRSVRLDVNCSIVSPWVAVRLVMAIVSSETIRTVALDLAECGTLETSELSHIGTLLHTSRHLRSIALYLPEAGDAIFSGFAEGGDGDRHDSVNLSLRNIYLSCRGIRHTNLHSKLVGMINRHPNLQTMNVCFPDVDRANHLAVGILRTCVAASTQSNARFTVAFSGEPRQWKRLCRRLHTKGKPMEKNSNELVSGLSSQYHDDKTVITVVR